MPFFSNTERDLFETSYKILKENWNFKNPIRMLTITATDFEEENNKPMQLNMFDDTKKASKKLENFDESIDKIRKKFGNKAICFASGLKSELISDHEDKEDEN